jgi:RIO-like serine/threonine protein kinase
LVKKTSKLQKTTDSLTAIEGLSQPQRLAKLTATLGLGKLGKIYRADSHERLGAATEDLQS